MNREILSFLFGLSIYMVLDIFDVLHLWLRKKFKKLNSEKESKFFEK